MTEPIVSVPMSEMNVIRDRGRLRMLLGSCVGLLLHDPVLRIAGMAHILLPDSSMGRPVADDQGPAKYVDRAVPELLRRTRGLAAGRFSPVVHIAGGARMFGSVDLEDEVEVDRTVGALNVIALREAIGKTSLPLASSHCGGTVARRMAIDLDTGTVTVDRIGDST